MDLDVQKSITEFLNIFDCKYEDKVDIGLLMVHLDKLAYLAGVVNFEIDETDYPDAPPKKYSETRKKIESLFPNIGYYNSLEYISDNISESKVFVGDAVDDLADIVGDLEEVIWYFDNTSSNNALWHFQNSFISHWGRHLRELQLYIHDRWW